MCFILDTNVFGAFFDENNSQHHNFAPAKKWVFDGNGKLVYGGTKYKSEMKKVIKYLGLFRELAKIGKFIEVCEKKVNQYEHDLLQMNINSDFDDHHLIAIILASKCKIICTNDLRAIPYLKDTAYYKNGVKKPKIYKTNKNKSLLRDQNIAKICSESI
jgi:predicted nucleic acid-binding protein